MGYEKIYEAKDKEELKKVLEEIKNINELIFIEVKCKIGAREDLGRPTSTPEENKISFMENLNK